MEIKVILENDTDNDVLRFEGLSNLKINLNEETGDDIKLLFISLLELLMGNYDDDICLTLECDEKYKPVMYKEIAEEYLSQLNTELKNIRTDYIENILPLFE